MTIFDKIKEKALDQGRTEVIHVVKLWLQNVPIPKIAESVGLSVEQIEKPLANFKKNRKN